MRHGRLRLLKRLKRKTVDDWVSACRNVEVTGVLCMEEMDVFKINDDDDEISLVSCFFVEQN